MDLQSVRSVFLRRRFCLFLVKVFFFHEGIFLKWSKKFFLKFWKKSFFEKFSFVFCKRFWEGLKSYPLDSFTKYKEKFFKNDFFQNLEKFFEIILDKFLRGKIKYY